MSRDEPEAATRRTETVERELKFPCDNLEGMRERLLAFEAERLAAGGVEENVVYDRKGRLLEKREILRLRRDRSGWSLTFKGAPVFEDGVKIRTERESKVENGDEVHAILLGLGYEVVKRYEKKREEWRLGGVTVALDHTPIGDFVEFEGGGAAAVARRCEFDVEQAETRTYLELYEDYRRQNPEAPPDMVFS
jgi:predicted adenylyl cyclase CyaB